MTVQREGFLGDILDKVKDLVTDDDRKDEKREEDPPLTPACCGGTPIPPLVGGGEGPTMLHEVTCKNYKA
ncbi:hypothetical protein SAMN05216188_112123 [Lentzea xinjiangensis]|uniref:Uncharacterized protein n=1 Tax=Lentzea xinjiangensis TaxID=402600 RepID=A0A1H9PX47_9PSEU|nr:hypothetical protein [Lentzea xinjiangensis]SER52764.1 hypothetical protein SAMN05216188_112123 [Lentzea xinjiangensis]